MNFKRRRQHSGVHALITSLQFHLKRLAIMLPQVLVEKSLRVNGDSILLLMRSRYPQESGISAFAVRQKAIVQIFWRKSGRSVCLLMSLDQDGMETLSFLFMTW
ncbi:hypothetical protein [Syntrophus gentianae]|uniref:hypothetical protein n=1 Tax=Syntrophus gentianae TaxID=43775 RepID=UPI001F3F8CFD|nr:hypothetical protein [Syntrophus gentianae]